MLSGSPCWRLRRFSPLSLSRDARTAVCPCDELGFRAKHPKLFLGAAIPATRNRNQPALFVERLECEPSPAVTFAESDSSLTDRAAIEAASALDTVPREALHVAAIRKAASSLHFRGLGIPHLPVRPVSVDESSVCHCDLLPHADWSAIHRRMGAGTMPPLSDSASA